MNLHFEVDAGHGPPFAWAPRHDSTIGRAAGCDLRLVSWRVAKVHARLLLTPTGCLLEDLGSLAGIAVNGQRVVMQHGPLQAGDRIAIGPYTLHVKDHDATDQQGEEPPAVVQPSRMAVQGGPGPDAPQPTAMNAARHHWQRRLHGRLLDTLDLRRQDISHMSDQALRQTVTVLVHQLAQEMQADWPADIPVAQLCQQVIDEAVGLGPLEALLQDDQISEIMVNRHDEVFVERDGRLQRHPVGFSDPRAVMGVIERIVAPIGRRIDESSPMVDARLSDGSRVNAVIPPLALKGPCLTIRKFNRQALSAADLVQRGSLSQSMAQFLDTCVQHRRNLIVSGGTGAGKTTLLNILSNFIPAGERIITIEDAAELQLRHQHLIGLECRPANAEGHGAVTVRDLVRNALRMRPDRIVVGECRGSEALDMLQAMNTGHEGSLTTLHANAVRDALSRLETMVLMAGLALPLQAIREQIASAIDIVVQQVRLPNGRRIVSQIAEITGIESGTIQLQDLFRYQPTQRQRDEGSFIACGLVPVFYEELQQQGVMLDTSAFKPAQETDHTPEAAWRPH
jgi:pilus assembly protein CpaF